MNSIADHDVIVIGAGVSGLLTAHRLQAAGRQVIVLEADTQPGGRTRSPVIGGGPVDLGASWVWDHEVHVHALLRELELATYRPYSEGLDRYQRGGQVQTLKLPGSWSPEARIVGGTEAIARTLVDRVANVVLGARVTAIELEGAILRVRTANGDHRARTVVAALPPALLARTVDLPPLPERTIGLLRRVPVWMGDVAKVVAVYETPFWRARGLSGRAASVDGPMVEVHELSGPDDVPAALFGFVPRDFANEQLEEHVRRQLGVLFGEEATRPSHLVVRAWWSQPHTFPEGLDNSALRLFGDPGARSPLLAGRLHLASTETAAVSPGHIDGAVARAEEVARAILSST